MSNCVPHEPVVSRLSGCLYERSLIEQYVADHGRCPVTGEPLRKEDLIMVRPTVLKPAVAAAASAGGGGAVSSGSETVPGLLARLHSQWGAIMLEQFSLRQQLAQTQQELAQALHQYESACRVIATFIKDHDAAGGERAQFLRDENENNGDNSAGTSLPDTALRDLGEYDALQRVKRKTRVASPSLASAQNVRDFVEDGCIEVGKSVWAVALSTDNTVFAGIDDATVAQYDVANGRICATGLGHERAVRHVVSYNAGGALRVVSASDDATLRVWSCEADALLCQGVVRQHNSGVVGLGGVMAGHLLLSASATRIGLADIGRMESVASTTAAAEGLEAFMCLGVHPYGSVAALGVDGAGLCIWNTRQMCVDTLVSLHGEDNVCSVAFSADCFTVATGLRGGKTLLWDLRKMSGPLHTVAPLSATPSTASSAGCSDLPVVSFDGSGKYLAVAGREIRLFDWDNAVLQGLATLSFHLQPATGVCWGVDARSLTSCSTDGTVKLYGTA
ncbi:putative splicing factor XB2 [Trypanosoma rangeli]|uniref:Pre-mRNA-processing factor 19 n=1 Tax=Trypanosoma rangeli TaxID=5698 RepID=A0A3R7NBE4_TRYRA|nr:putative splicing factor XB2 [Trypanosoma rangeli]RNF03715.1 putative splicing factor XB2 [Trypanosoma rangeli]|eukprot:RNF03715.1 putative splicing factor XB2 [Trypanosoma rangeli]